MPKVTLDMNTFKALASDTRLDILRALDGKKMSLKDISTATRLNKATLHEHLQRLNEAGLVKRKEREGHKWVYYKLTWKGEGLLHPENTRIVVMFTATFVALAVGIIQLLNFAKGYVVAKAVTFAGSDSTAIYAIEKGAGKAMESAPAPYSTCSQAPIAYVPVANQTTDQLSHALLDNADIRGIALNNIPKSNIEWEVSSWSAHAYDEADLLAGDAIDNGASSTVESSMVAIAHDPAFQWIGVICIAIFCVLLSVAVWRLWKNRIPKL